MDTAEPVALLHGVRILSFTESLPGPRGVQYLADMGADVIQACLWLSPASTLRSI
jgi:crotonobetainyl-CoA:carnitine CoA-transferase CaiB-like acyl-CoA transferase